MNAKIKIQRLVQHNNSERKIKQQAIRNNNIWGNIEEQLEKRIWGKSEIVKSIIKYCESKKGTKRVTTVAEPNKIAIQLGH